MTEDQYVGWGLAIIGAALLLFNAWLTYVDRKANAIIQQAIRKADMSPMPDPAFVDRLRGQVQAAAWEHDRTPMYDRIAERRLAQALEDDEAVTRWLS